MRPVNRCWLFYAATHVVVQWVTSLKENLLLMTHKVNPLAVSPTLLGRLPMLGHQGQGATPAVPSTKAALVSISAGSKVPSFLAVTFARSSTWN